MANMSLDWLVILILAELLLLPILGGVLHWLLSEQADNSQGRPPLYHDAPSNGSTREERDDDPRPPQPFDPEAPCPSDSSTSSSPAPLVDGDCERRMRLVRALYFLRGRLEEQGGELNPWERQTMDEATRLLSSGNCVNDARLFIYPESYSAPVVLDNTYEAEFIRIYGRSPATILVHKNDEDFVAITNKLGDLTRDCRLNENDLQIVRSSVHKAQSILISRPDLLAYKTDPSLELSDLRFDINTKYQYLRAVAESRQQYFDIRHYYGPRYIADWDQPDPNSAWLHNGTQNSRRREHGVQQDADTRPPRLVQQTQAAQQYAHDVYTSQPPPSSPPPTVDQQLHQPEAMGYSNPILPREAHLPTVRYPQPTTRGPPQPPTIHDHHTPQTPPGSRRQPYSVPYQSPPTMSPTAQTQPQAPASQRPFTPPLGPNRTGTWTLLESITSVSRWSKQEKKKAEKRRKQD